MPVFESGEIAVHAILSLPTPMLVAALFAVVALATVLAAALLVFYTRAGFAPLAAPVPTFIGVIAASWALALGFAAADIWTLGAQADRAAAAERSSVTRLLGASAPAALDLPALHEATRSYAQLVATREWGESGNSVADPEVDETLQAMRIAIIALAQSGVPSPLVAKVVQDFDELQDARNDRLAVGVSLVDESKWYLVLVLMMMAMVAIAAVHPDRPRAGIHALVIFAIVAFSSLLVLAIHVDPYAQRELSLTTSAAQS